MATEVAGGGEAVGRGVGVIGMASYGLALATPSTQTGRSSGERCSWAGERLRMRLALGPTNLREMSWRPPMVAGGALRARVLSFVALDMAASSCVQVSAYQDTIS